MGNCSGGLTVTFVRIIISWGRPMYDEREKRLQDLKKLFLKVVPYFIDLAAGIGIGLAGCLILGIPFTFFRDINMNIVHFLFGIPVMCVTLYRRSFRRGYHTNSRTYLFSLKKSVQYIGICIAAQSLVVVLLGAHAVYVTGPTYWITDILFPSAFRSETGGNFLWEGHDWLLMFLADVFVYGPIMIYGEYVGCKERKIDYQLETQEY